METLDLLLVALLLVAMFWTQLKALFHSIVDTTADRSGLTVVLLKKAEGAKCLGKRLKEKVSALKSRHMRYSNQEL
jgi:hypothetical protein